MGECRERVADARNPTVVAGLVCVGHRDVLNGTVHTAFSVGRCDGQRSARRADFDV